MRLVLALTILLVAVPAHAQQPQSSRQVFQAAAAQPRGSAQAIRLYREYVSMEPDDAWGYLALAEALAAAGEFAEAQRAIEEAAMRAPGEDDVAIVRARVLRAQRDMLPVIQSSVTLGNDTDENRLQKITFSGDVAVGPSTRLGLNVSRVTTDMNYVGDDGRLNVVVKTRTMRVEAGAGLARFDHERQYYLPVAQGRLRWSPPGNAPLIDIRARHAPLFLSSALIQNEGVLSEARATLELPLVGNFRVRGQAQVGNIATMTATTPGRNPTQPQLRTAQRNARLGYGGGLVLRASPITEFSGQFYQLSYADPVSEAGYFAPRLVQLAEMSSYAEIYGLDPLTLILDAGAGMQRVAPHFDPAGDWSAALRAWLQASWSVSRYFELTTEIEAYRSQFATVAASDAWSAWTAGLGMRWRVP